VKPARAVSRILPLLTVAALWADDAPAAPQASLGATLGGAVEETGSAPLQRALSLGARADVLFGRSRGTDMAIGPYVEGGTLGFQSLDVAAGAEWLLPVRDDLPLVLSGGALLRNGDGRSWARGAEGAIFFGSRSYNFHSWYGLAAGLFAQVRWIPGSPDTVDFVFGIQLDAELLAMPALLLIGLFK